MKVATVLDSSLPISMVRRHNGMISVDSRKLITWGGGGGCGGVEGRGGGGLHAQRSGLAALVVVVVLWRLQERGEGTGKSVCLAHQAG